MASRYLFPIAGALQSGLVHLVGYFSTDSSGDIENGVAGKTDLDGDTLLLPPWCSAAAKTGTGLYTITLADTWTKFEYVNIELMISAASKLQAQIYTVNPKGQTVGGVAAQTVNFGVVDKNAGAEAAFASKKFFVHFIMKNSPVEQV